MGRTAHNSNWEAELTARSGPTSALRAGDPGARQSDCPGVRRCIHDAAQAVHFFTTERRSGDWFQLADPSDVGIGEGRPPRALTRRAHGWAHGWAGWLGGAGLAPRRRFRSITAARQPAAFAATARDQRGRQPSACSALRRTGDRPADYGRAYRDRSPSQGSSATSRAATIGRSYGGVTSRDFPVVMRVNRRRSRVVRAVIAISTSCTAGGLFITPDGYTRLAIRRGKFSSSFGPVTQRNASCGIRAGFVRRSGGVSAWASKNRPKPARCSHPLSGPENSSALVRAACGCLEWPRSNSMHEIGQTILRSRSVPTWAAPGRSRAGAAGGSRRRPARQRPSAAYAKRADEARGPCEVGEGCG